MSGYDIFRKVMLRLSYTDTYNKLSVKALEFINQICIDLKIPVIESLSEKIEQNSEVLEALCCGVAMLLTVSEGDSEKNSLYTALYNSKRASVLSKVTLVEDVLPNLQNGGL